jgi:hypothetical protein
MMSTVKSLSLPSMTSTAASMSPTRFQAPSGILTSLVDLGLHNGWWKWPSQAKGVRLSWRGSRGLLASFLNHISTTSVKYVVWTFVVRKVCSVQRVLQDSITYWKDWKVRIHGIRAGTVTSSFSALREQKGEGRRCILTKYNFPCITHVRIRSKNLTMRLASPMVAPSFTLHSRL